jgi:hypothetical protein
MSYVSLHRAKYMSAQSWKGSRRRRDDGKTMTIVVHLPGRGQPDIEVFARE